MENDDLRLYNTLQKLWNESFFTKQVAKDIYPILMTHRMHHDEPWHEALDQSCTFYQMFFATNPDYRWLVEPGVNVTLFNQLLFYKKEGKKMPLEMIKTLIITANLERTGKITEKEGNIRSADAVEKVHPSGIQKILGK